MLSTQDATRISIFGKEQALQYHLSQMRYHFECAQTEVKEVQRSLKDFYRHQREAEELQSSLEEIC